MDIFDKPWRNGSVTEAKGSGRLQCMRCGWCCQDQLISVSTVEIRAITDFLNQRGREEFEDHVVSSLAYEGNLDPYDIKVEERLNDLLNFAVPGEIEFFEEKAALVRTHVIRILSESRRCVFYNPVSSSCVIYPARPLTCRLFPYDVKDDRIVMVDESDECPGVGKGDHVNFQRHRRISRMCLQLLHDDDILFWRFAAQKGLKWKRSGKHPPLSAVNLIDPFVETGQIPSPKRSQQ